MSFAGVKNEQEVKDPRRLPEGVRTPTASPNDGGRPFDPPPAPSLIGARATSRTAKPLPFGATASIVTYTSLPLLIRSVDEHGHIVLYESVDGNANMPGGTRDTHLQSGHRCIDRRRRARARSARRRCPRSGVDVRLPDHLEVVAGLPGEDGPDGSATNPSARRRASMRSRIGRPTSGLRISRCNRQSSRNSASVSFPSCSAGSCPSSTSTGSVPAR